MKNKLLLLLRTLMLSTSSLNTLKYTRDKKKKGKIIGGYVGMAWLYVLLIGYCALTAIGFGAFGLADMIPAMTVVTISIISFFFTMLKAGSYLFGFHEYDMLMALPFSEKEIVAGKFLYMYSKDIGWDMSVSVAMLIGYAVNTSPSWYVYPLWILLSLFIPVIPMLAASFVGYLIAKVGTKFKHWKAVQIILTMAFALAMFSLRFIIEAVFRNNDVSDVVTGTADKINGFGRVYFPVTWFTNAVTKGNILSGLLFVAVSVALFEVVFYILSRSYKRINSTMKTGASSGHTYKVQDVKGFRKKSVVQAIAIKELKRFFGSTNYFVNVGFGYILAVIAAVISLFVGVDKIASLFVQGVTLTPQNIIPVLPFVIYFFTGMVPMTTCSPSLEGKNFWIVKSSPLTDRQLYTGKILASLYISVPAHLFATLCMCISAKAAPLETIGFLVLGLMLCIFSSVYGCVCGIHFIKLEWENEIDVIKRGTAVVAYMFPNMFLTMGLAFGSVFMGRRIGILAVIIISIIIYTVLTAIFSLMLVKMRKA